MPITGCCYSLAAKFLVTASVDSEGTMFGVQSDNSLLSVVYRLLDEEVWQRCTVRQQFVQCCVQVVR